jgi:protocatechuate 3,4-dioxygenase beta subunit
MKKERRDAMAGTIFTKLQWRGWGMFLLLWAIRPGLAQPPPERTTVQGVVTLADGKTPVGGLTVTLAPATDEPTAFGGAQTVTDGKGRFTFKDVPEGNYRLMVLLLPEVDTLIQELHVVGTKPVEVTVRLEGVAAAMGRVVGPDGQPVAHTTIPLTVWQSSTGWSLGIVTGPGGEYVLILKKPGHYHWWAVLPGVGCAEASADLHGGPNLFGAAQTGVDLRLQPGGRASGKVQSETGEPVRDTRVRLWTEGYGAFGTVAEDGTFTLADLPPGGYRVYVDSETFYSGGPHAEFTVKSGQVVDGLLIKLKPLPKAIRVTGRVLAEGGKTPLADAKVILHAPGWWFVTRTDREGRFVFEKGRAGSFRLKAFGPGYAAEDIAVDVKPTPDEQPFDVVLRHQGGTIRGRVVDRRGEPLAEARVVAIPQATFTYRGLGRGLLERPPRSDQQEAWIGDDAVWTEVRPDGTYTLEHMAEGEYAVCALRPDPPHALREQVQVREGAATEGVDLTMDTEAQVFLAGQVWTPDGTPLAQADVEVAASFARLPDRFTTDAEGRFRWYHPNLTQGGPVVVRAEEVGVAQERLVPDEVGNGRRAVPAAFDLHLRPGATLGGGVTAARNGQPLEGVEVQFQLQDPATFPLPPVRTEADGSFTLEQVPPGRGKLEIQPPGGYLWEPSRELTVEPGEVRRDLNFTLSRGAMVTGRVVDPQGQPVPGAVVRLDGEWDVKADAEGGFRFENRRPGVFFLEAQGADYLPARRWLEVQEVGAGLRASPSVELQLRPGSTLTGTVRDPAGKPLAGVQVAAVAVDLFLRDWREEPLWTGARLKERYGSWLEQNTRTDGQGRYALTGLPDDEYVVILLDEAWPLTFSDPVTAHLGRGGPPRQPVGDLRPEPEGFVRLGGRVAKPDGTPLTNADLTLEIRRWGHWAGIPCGRTPWAAIAPGCAHRASIRCACPFPPRKGRIGGNRSPNRRP